MPLSEPPRDGNGQVKPHDHSGVGDTDRAIRRISAEHIVTDEKAATGKRISRMAFQTSTEGNRGMSVDLEALILEAGLDARRFVTTPKYTGSVSLPVGTLRAETLMVGYDPLPNNPYHGEVWGNLTKGCQGRLLKASEWFVEIESVTLTRG